MKKTILTLTLASLVSCGSGGSGSGSSDSGNDTKPSYTVTGSSTEGAAISPASASVTQGDTQTFNISLDDKYEIDTVTGCNGSLSGNNYVTGAINSNCEVTVSAKLKSFSIGLLVWGQGTVSPEDQIVTIDESITFTLSPAEGYGIATVQGCEGQLNGNEFVLDPVTAECTLEVTFRTDDGIAPVLNTLHPVNSTFKHLFDSGIVRGTATDADGIKAIELSDDSIELTLSQDLSTLPTSVDWQFTAPDASKVLTISTVDATGNTNNEAAQFNVKNDDQPVPSHITVDTTGNRLLGFATADTLVITHLDDLSTTELTISPSEFRHRVAFRQLDSNLMFAKVSESTLSLMLMDLDEDAGTATVSTVAEHELEVSDDLWNWVSVADIEFNATGTKIYMNLLFDSTVGWWENDKTMLVEYDFDQQSFDVVFDDVDADDTKLVTRDFAISEEGFYFVNSPFVGFENTLSLLDPTGTSRTEINTENTFLAVKGVEHDDSQQTTYLLQANSVSTHNHETGKTELLYDNANASPFLNMRSKFLDTQNNRLIVTSDEVGAASIDLTDGVLTTISPDHLGSGDKLSDIQFVSFDRTNQVLYIATSASSQGSKIVRIELSSGQKTEVVSLTNLAAITHLNGFEYNSENETFYFANDDQLLSYQSGDDSVTEVASSSLNNGEQFVVDSQNNIAYMLQRDLNSVVAIDLNNGATTTVSGADKGTGDALNSSTSIAFNAEANVLYVASQSNGTVTVVDIETGDRSLLLDSCGSESFDGIGMTGIYYAPEAQSLYIDQTNAAIADVNTASCEIVGAGEANRFVELGSDQMLYISLDQVVQFDKLTNSFSIIVN